MLVRSLPIKSRKGWVRDAFDAFPTQSGLVHDVINLIAGWKIAALTIVFSPLSNVHS